MRIFDQFEKNEKRILIASTAGAIICLFLLFLSDDFYVENQTSRDPEIGQISFKMNDVRLKARHSFVWQKSSGDQAVHTGDAVFSGENSRAHIELKKGGNITIGANSLVSFRELDQMNLADLTSGNFHVKVNGTVKVSVGGVITELKGDNSEVQIVVAKNKLPQVRLLKGNAELKRPGKAAVQLERTKVTQLEAPPPQLHVAEQLPVPPPVMLEPIEPPEVPSNLGVSAFNSYVWRLYDLYEQNGAVLTERRDRPKSVPARVGLSWRPSNDGKPATVTLAANPEFTDATRADAFGNSFETERANLGENFWRVSFDDATWSASGKFTVTAGFLEGAEPKPSKAEASIPLIGEKTTFPLHLESKVASVGFVIQASTAEDFQSGESRLYWYPSPDLNLSFFKPGAYYYRFRTVNKAQELSQWSSPTAIRVFVPEKVAPPVLRQAKREGFVGEKFPVRWHSKGARSEIELSDESGKVLSRQAGDHMVWVSDEPATVLARAYAFDEYGRPSAPSNPVKLEARARPVPLVAKIEPPPEPVKRQPAVVEAPSTTSNKVELPSAFFNGMYKNSTYSIEGFLMTMQSSEQYYQQKEAPVSAGLGLKMTRWFERYGFEAMMKMKMVGANETGRASSLKDAEARLHYRFFTGFPFGWSRELQTSIFTGAELYRNSGALFNGKSDLLKFGTMFEFPWAVHWRAGGEFVYGRGFDRSTKYEISGHMNYFYRRDWSFGVGYRIHLFQAGSTGASPSGYLPYREGYTEGFSVLDFYY